MLKITNIGQIGSDFTVKLEGKLLGPWVEEVRLHFVTDALTLPRLDLSSLTFVDRAGTELLRQLLDRGIQVESCSPYVAEVLHLDRTGPVDRK